MPSLNPRQQAAVRHLDSPLLVLAGAGSGKTRVITEKIGWLIRECGLAPRNIAAVTFTNKAAREMKARVGGLLGQNEVRDLTVSTFHTLGLNILRREHGRLGLRPGFTILDAQDTAGLVRELLRQDSGADPALAESHLHRISRWKNDLLDPATALSRAADAPEAAAARLYATYERQLRAYNALDFDALITLPVRLFQDHPEVLERWQNRIRYLLVDEYQDTNAAQYRLVRQLTGVQGAFTVVGDDDQSIYGWRGARPDNLARLAEDYPRLTVIKLEQNYRSSGRILRSANRVIANNPHVFDKALWSEYGPGDPLRILQVANEEQEAERVVTEIISHRFQHRARYGDYAILYRGNHQARLFERVLRAHSVPYHLSGDTSFFARTEVKDVIAYLRLLANPEDDAAFLRVVNTPRREIGPGTLEKLGEYARHRQTGLLAAAGELGLAQHLPERALERLRRFSHWLGALRRQAEDDDPVAVTRQLLRDIDYEGWLHETCKDPKTAERRWENVRELVDWVENLARHEDRGKNLAGIVAHIALMDLLDRDDEEAAGDQVRMMTLHAAKGLEFPHVFMVGVEEEILPHRSSLEEDNVEEERRLAYVGITRAMRTLTLTYCRRRKQYGEWVECVPSRFLEELPADDVAWERRGEARSPEERQTTGRAHLANLKSLLG